MQNVAQHFLAQYFMLSHGIVFVLRLLTQDSPHFDWSKFSINPIIASIYMFFLHKHSISEAKCYILMRKGYEKLSKERSADFVYIFVLGHFCVQKDEPV